MENNLLKVALRQNAVFIPKQQIAASKTISHITLALVANLQKLGYTVSEELLHALNSISVNQAVSIYDTLKNILGMNQNWAPLVKGWDTPTNETRLDHVITAFANLLKAKNGVTLACGHIIPPNTFPIERYNGCPFCGTPFQLALVETVGQGSKLKMLNLWTEDNLINLYTNLLQSATALDATQMDSLKILLKNLSMPAVEVKMKETQVAIIDYCVSESDIQQAAQYLRSPNDILRYLWYKQTGFMQIIQPKVLIARTTKNNRYQIVQLNKSKNGFVDKKTELKLKYDRFQCRMVATWLNQLDMTPESACEIMHPKRGMWVRFIRALRLAEYAKKAGFEYLNQLMDVFYNQTYTVYQGEVNTARIKSDAEHTFALLKQRPGLFARSLFANMLWFGDDATLAAFEEVIDKVPARLILTLGMYADSYFDPKATRVVKPLGGNAKVVKPNALLNLYDNDQLEAMMSKVRNLTNRLVMKRFSQISTDHETIYIDPALYNIPLSIGDRSETVQDLSCALMGTRFAVEGNAVRLFMQWGKDLPAQHLDMDLSCHISFADRVEKCSYFSLQATGAKHSGDIRSIPDRIGTAEYIELDLNALAKSRAKYVVFTCNAYSDGALSPNMVIGWMNSAYPMKISNKTGVAYDPSCVQHQVKVSQSLSKGMVFGLLDVAAREITWLEMPFQGQTVSSMNAEGVEAFLKKLRSKTTIGQLLSTKAQAQNLQIVDAPYADEVYTMEWAMDTAGVTKLLID